ncbi:MAG: ZIP family metal transporter [Acidobacteria bacterium]|nr:ZIP family metal transporter [Acidobacteriota bacterium]
MSTPRIIALGAIAGFTIFLGLPAGRLRGGRSRGKTILNGVSAGILIFLLLDILGHAEEPLEAAVGGRHWGRLAGLGLVYSLGIGIGLMGLHILSRAMAARAPGVGPGAMAIAEPIAESPRAEALRLGMSIAAGIGLHNFAEGLAIGQTARAGEISLALLLVIGFALHNATEGFGIVGPLAAAGERPSWGWLGLAGIVGGGPTFIGTIVGNAVTSEYVFVAFLALAAGAILSVVGELLDVGRRLSWDLTLWGILAGLLVSVATELVLGAAGA